jgi:hypothetical protein
VDSNLRIFNNENIKKEEGTEPVKELYLMLMICNLTNSPNSEGILPINGLPPISIEVRPMRDERETGIVPVKRLE